MARWGRWLIASAAALATFGVAMWAVRVVSFSWLPRTDADRWVVAVGFATVAAAAVGAATGWWAGRDIATDADHAGDDPDTGVRQQARASGHATVTQVGGDQHITGRQQP